MGHIIEPSQADSHVAKVLRDSGAETLLNLIPGESHDTAGFYADAATRDAKIGFVNSMPTPGLHRDSRYEFARASACCLRAQGA